MMFFNGWSLTKAAREAIFAIHPPTHEVVRCDHVTLDICDVDTPPPPPAFIWAYGYLDFDGYQVLAVTVDGRMYQPRDDRMFHVTMSHKLGHPSSHAGLLLKQRACVIKGFTPFALEATPFMRKVGPPLA